MTDWDGRGLPPVAARRIERARTSGVHTSLLSVPGQIGLDSCGFVPVGEVMGCAVRHLGFQGWGGCGWMPMGGYYAPTTTATRRSGGYFGLAPYLESLEESWALAIGRMLEEARQLGADGVVDVRLSDATIDEQQNREFVALGTAVRSLGSAHVPRPFSTTLGGDDVSKLLRSGYVPSGIIVAISLGIRHDDWRTQQATSVFMGNIEVPGYTDLVETIRSDARDELRRQTRAHGADGAITTAPMQMAIHEVEVGEGHRDHVGIATLHATAVAAFKATSPTHTTRPAVFLAGTERRSP